MSFGEVVGPPWFLHAGYLGPWVVILFVDIWRKAGDLSFSVTAMTAWCRNRQRRVVISWRMGHFRQHAHILAADARTTRATSCRCQLCTLSGRPPPYAAPSAAGQVLSRRLICVDLRASSQRAPRGSLMTQAPLAGVSYALWLSIGQRSRSISKLAQQRSALQFRHTKDAGSQSPRRSQ